MADKTLRQKLEEFPKAVWVQMHRDRMQILNHQGQVKHTVLPIQKYDHPRSIIANFEAAESTLKQLIKMQKLPWYDPNLTLLLQVKETFEGGITFVENRALRELGYNTGAKNVLIFDAQGQCLNADEAATSSSFIHSVYSKILLFIVVIAIIFSVIYMK